VFLTVNCRLANYTKVQFLVVINPNSGPGNITGPGNISDDNWQREIPRINSYGNVRTIGYVKTGYGARDINNVLREVAQYGSWTSIPTNSSDIYNGTMSTYGLHGIFFDETPNFDFTPEIGEYYNQIDGYVKNQTTFGGINFVLSFP
jgi:Spherulation-specific family 4